MHPLTFLLFFFSLTFGLVALNAALDVMPAILAAAYMVCLVPAVVAFLKD
jgi:hypothetical protein